MAVQEIKIHTAKEFLKTKTLSPSKNMYGGYNIPYSYLQSLLIEFAKLHVEAALDTASNVELSSDIDYESGKEYFYQNYDGIKNAYPLTNIK